MAKALIIGMGIGKLYQDIYKKLRFDIVTVDSDPSKNADFATVQSALKYCYSYATVHICTPNYTHQEISEEVLDKADVDVMFIEKPGFIDKNHWVRFVMSHRNTRIMMVKNNMWRDNIDELKNEAISADYVNIGWSNKNRIPHPGSWFTTQQLSYGGVSRDLMPHLLSFYVALNPNWETDPLIEKFSRRNYTLDEITGTDYGTVHTDGIYDVEDECSLEYGRKWNLFANWANGELDDRSINFVTYDKLNVNTFEFGLCPEVAYKNMIVSATTRFADDKFWNNQLTIDTWIHSQIGLL
jgi:hypothetical protein